MNKRGIAKSLVGKCDKGISPGRCEEVAKGSQLAGRCAQFHNLLWVVLADSWRTDKYENELFGS